MMTADDRLTLIRTKSKRADQHTAELVKAVRGRVLQGTSISSDGQLQGGKTFLNVSSFNIYAPEIPAVTGDAVHNLRSGLGHSAFHLVWVRVDKGNTRKTGWEKIQFPITHSEDSYKSDRTAEK